jgi:hypothetical protein
MVKSDGKCKCGVISGHPSRSGNPNINGLTLARWEWWGSRTMRCIQNFEIVMGIRMIKNWMLGSPIFSGKRFYHLSISNLVERRHVERNHQESRWKIQVPHKFSLKRMQWIKEQFNWPVHFTFFVCPPHSPASILPWHFFVQFPCLLEHIIAI